MSLSVLANAQEHNFLSFGIEDGLPQIHIKDMLQDHQAYLWIATQGGGVARFDGSQFETFTTREGLPSNFITCLFEKNDSLYIGSRSGIAVFYNGKLKFTVATDVEITSMITHGQDILLGTSRGLYLYSSDLTKVNTGTMLDESVVHDIIYWNNKIYLATSKGMFRQSSDHSMNFTLLEQFQSDYRALATDTLGNLWLGNSEGLLNRLSQTSEQQYFYNLPRRASINDIIIIGDEIWVATLTSGLYNYNTSNNEWTHILSSQGIGDSNIQCLYSDASDHLWVGTTRDGLKKYLGQLFQHIGSDEGLPEGGISAIEIDQNEHIWLATDDHGISCIVGRDIYNQIDSGLIQSRCNDLYQDKNGVLWISTSGQGLYIYSDSVMSQITLRNGLPSLNIKSVIEDQYSNIWVATSDNGIARIQKSKSKFKKAFSVNVYNRDHGLLGLNIAGLYQDYEQRIWYADQEGGLGYFDGKEWILYNLGLPTVEIRSVVFDLYGRIYVGTSERGIWVGDLDMVGIEFERLEIDISENGDNIQFLQFDQNQDLWVGLSKGVLRLDCNQSGTIIGKQYYGYNQGFSGIQTNENAIDVDESGNIYFGTINGLTKHEPSGSFEMRTNPTVHIEDVLVQYQSIHSATLHDKFLNDDKSAYRLDYSQNHIEIRFKGVDLILADHLKYSWRLKGLDDEWNPPSDTRTVAYTNLPPGFYEFQLKAQNTLGKDSATVLVPFEIVPAVWQRGWFRIGVGLLSLLLMLALFQWNMRRIKRKESKKRKELELQNELLTLEQSALQLQMNPHFIFNVLNSIQSLVVAEKTQEARKQIQTFASLMRSILNNSRKEEISLQEEASTLKKYLDMEQLDHSNSFIYEVKVSEKIDAEEVYIPPMIFQPLIENALIHGLKNSLGEGKISISFLIEGRLLLASIVDNGIGRKASQEYAKGKAPGHQSVALDVIEKRLLTLQGSLKYIPIEFYDLYNESGEATGTRVVVRMPYNSKF